MTGTTWWAKSRSSNLFPPDLSVQRSFELDGLVFRLVQARVRDQARELGVGARDGAHEAAVNRVLKAHRRGRRAFVEREERGARDFEKAGRLSHASVGRVRRAAQRAHEADQL